MFYSFDWTDLHVDIPGKPPSSIARWTKILFSFCHCPTEILLRNYVTTCNLRSFIYYLCILVFVYNDHLFSCNHWYLHLPDIPTISLCAFDNMLSKVFWPLVALPFFQDWKNVNKAQCPQDFYTKPFQQGTTPSIGTHGVYQMSRLHYVTSASF